MTALATLVMARAPVPGNCKTRLESRLGPAGCARLQTALIAHAGSWAATVGGVRSAIAVTPDDAIAEVAALAPGVRITLGQTGDDLGARLTDASTRVLDRAGPGTTGLLVVGTDLPVLGTEHAAAATAALAAGADVVFGPCFDGGYHLVGLRRADARIFALPPDRWGGPDVLELSLRACAGAGLRAVVLDRCEHDLDVPADIDRALGDPRTSAPVRAALGAP